jgi:hypothetical protein
MSITTIKLSDHVRDRLAAVAESDFGGTTLGDAVDRLLAEHEDAKIRSDILNGYERLRADPEAFADYKAELDEWDVTAADGLSDRA